MMEKGQLVRTVGMIDLEVDTAFQMDLNPKSTTRPACINKSVMLLNDFEPTQVLPAGVVVMRCFVERDQARIALQAVADGIVRARRALFFSGTGWPEIVSLVSR